MLNRETKNVGAHQVLLTKQDGKIVDIEVLIDEKERRGFLSKFDQKDHSWKTSCYTYIFQQEIAKYKNGQLTKLNEAKNLNDPVEKFMDLVADLSGLFVQLEKFINNPPSYNYKESLEQLKIAIREYENGIHSKINNYPEKKHVLKE